MSTTRRTILGGALAAPFLASFTGTASGATADATWGTVSEGYVDLWLTPQSQRQLDLYQARVTPIAPATPLSDGGRKGVRFPVRSGTGALSMNNPAQSQGTALADGGLVVEGPMGRFELTQLRPALDNELASGRCLVNGVESGGESLVRCDTGAGRLLADPVPAGQPLKVRVEEVPVYPTPEALEAFKSAIGTPPLGSPVFDVDTVVAYVTADVVYVPPQP